MEKAFLENLTELFVRDIKRVSEEIAAYKTESNLWEVKGDVSNSGGTLALHLIGNLQHFIGSVLGNTGYVRERELEFTQRNVPRETIMLELGKVEEILTSVLPKISAHTLETDFPLPLGGKTLKTNFFLLHLYSHLNYHLGQINYHRRMMDC